MKRCLTHLSAHAEAERPNSYILMSRAIPSA
uniref:Uncharacterized protein n=1 Tax=Anguilla anguilla TaxID=7936 RepID=A0A0E9UCA1_ANGAN